MTKKRDCSIMVDFKLTNLAQPGGWALFEQFSMLAFEPLPFLIECLEARSIFASFLYSHFAKAFLV
jgi:hypothetical protein